MAKEVQMFAGKRLMSERLWRDRAPPAILQTWGCLEEDPRVPVLVCR